MYTLMRMYIATINVKRGHKSEREQRRVYGRVWKEEMEE